LKTFEPNFERLIALCQTIRSNFTIAHRYFLCDEHGNNCIQDCCYV